MRRIGIDPLRQAYAYQRVKARKRGIEWLFTYESWTAVWVASGRLSQRGKGAGDYCMARNGDKGPYSPENVQIITTLQNRKDAHINLNINHAKLGLGRGWNKVGGRFIAHAAHKYIGSFDSAEEAQAARAKVVAAIRADRALERA